MKQLLHLLAFGLLVPSTALAQVDAEVAAQCRDARDFYGCVRAFTTPVRRSDDTAPFDGVMGQVAAGLISGPTYRNAPTNFSRGMNPAGLVEGILRGALRCTDRAPFTCGSSPGIDRSGWWRRVWFCGR